MYLQQDFNYSYWELKHYFQKYDLIVIGSGIVGLSTAIAYKEKNKKATVLVLERGVFPDGASTRNAGFACFGSAGELLADLQKIDHKSVWETVVMRFEGLQLLLKRLGKKNIDYRAYGGYELFENIKVFNECAENLRGLNREMKSCLGITSCYKPVPANNLPFKSIKGVIKNRFEGQLDTGFMMKSLLKLAHDLEIDLLNGITVTALNDNGNNVTIHSSHGEFSASRVVVATNGFANQLLKIKDVSPARAQVLITEPIKNLKIKGAFHFEEGFYYFRNINNRILFGGGRNTDLKTETTDKTGLNKSIQKKLDHYLGRIILPGIPHKIETRWSGIMGVGKEKKPIIQFSSPNVLSAIRMGGMGIAIGSKVAEKAAAEISR